MGISCVRSETFDIPDYKIVKEGFLMKKSSFFGDHIRVWLVLTRSPNPLVIIYKSMQKKRNEMFFYFSLYDVEFSEVADYGLKFKKNRGNSKFSYSFHTADKLEYLEWTTIIKKYINKIVGETEGEETLEREIEGKWRLVLENGEEI
jgi:hypothetical protein